MQAFIPPDERIAKMPDGCWIWLGAVQTAGYGDHSRGLVHRLVAGARPGQHVHHVCGQRLCVRRDHLQVFESQAEHTAAHMRGRCVNGHPRTPENLRPRPRGSGFVCRPCDRERKLRERAACR